MRRMFAVSVLFVAAMSCRLLADPHALPIDKAQWIVPRWATTVTVENGDNNTPAIKIYTTKRDYSQQIRLPVFFDADVAKVTFTGRMKLKNVGGGAAAIEKCRAQVVFLDTAGDRVGNWPQTTDRDGTTDWEAFQQDHTCPPGTRNVEVWLGMYLSTGTAWFDSLQLTAYDSAGKELTPIKRTQSETTDTTGWWPFDPGTEDTTRPLVLDYSQFMPAPAGKFGFVTAKDGHFVFANGQRARFWGIGYVNNWHPEKADAPRLAEQLARAGINLVRFHGMDAMNPKASIFDDSSDKTDRLDPDKVDKLDFFFAELKKRGIYADMNLLTKRFYKPGDGVTDSDKLPQGGKVASMIDRRIIELQKDYAKLLLTHVNPYTQLAYKDDPAVAMIEMVNETSLNTLEFLGGTPPYYEKMLDDQFTEWCTKTSTDRPKGTVKVLIKQKENTAERFVEAASKDYYDEIYAYLKNDLKIPQPVSGSQFDGVVGEKRAQSGLDYFDHHGYWDHPAGGWDPLCLFRNKPMVKLGDGSLIEGLVDARVAGKPFTVSEWNCGWPNDYITEGPLLMSAYSSFQDWDAPMVFGTDGLGWQPAMTETFNATSKPHFMAALMAAAIPYYRGDVQPGPLYEVNIRKAKPGLKTGDIFTREQKLTMRCALVTDGKAGDPAKPIDKDANDKSQMPPVFASSDGQIRWISAGQFILNTPRTQAVVGFTGGEPLTIGENAIAIQNTFGQVIVTSLSDSPLASADHVLITATARAENTGETFRAFRKGLEKLGTGPILIEPVKAAVTLHHAGDAKPTVYALDWFGRRTATTLPVTKDASGAWQITLGTTPAMWFEVSFEATK